MGLILCKIHGRQGILLACHHAHEQFGRRERPRGISPIRGTLLPEVIADLFWCCDECRTKHGFDDTNRIFDFDDIPDELDLEPHCGACFRAWLGGEHVT
jgi:hypothetical protein